MNVRNLLMELRGRGRGRKKPGEHSRGKQEWHSERDEQGEREKLVEGGVEKKAKAE